MARPNGRHECVALWWLYPPDRHWSSFLTQQSSDIILLDGCATEAWQRATGILFSFCFSEKKPTPDEFPRLSPHPSKDDAQDRRPRACRLSRCLRALCGAFASYHQVGACIVTDNIQALLLSLMPPRAGTWCLCGDMAREAHGLEALPGLWLTALPFCAFQSAPVGKFMIELF